MELIILRLGHRPERDKRITTHVGLVGRALGAKGMLLTSNDKGIERSLREVTSSWGGDFFVQTGVKWKEEVTNWKRAGGKVCHLTMYGENILDVIGELRERAVKLMVVVGAEKVPFAVFEAADWNIAVGNQPHSEIAALALFLDHLQEGKELKTKFADAKLEIEPKRRGKAMKATET